MKNTGNNGNISNSKLDKANAAEQAKVENSMPNGSAPATIVLAQVSPDLPLPVGTEQDGIPDNISPPSQTDLLLSESELEDLDKAASENQEAGEDAREANVPGENTLLSQADLENLDETAAGNPVGDAIEEAVANSFGNLDDVNDTRYDWDRGPVPIEYRYSFDQDFTPEGATFSPPPREKCEPIPSDQIITRGGFYGELLQVYEAGLPDGSGNGNTTTYLFGNIFDTINLGPYTIDDVSILNLGVFFQAYNLDDSDPDNWILTTDHFTFTLDTQGLDKGDYSYQLTGNVFNPFNFEFPESQFKADVIDNLFITLLPDIGKGPGDCIPEPTNIQLDVRIVDDRPVAYDDCVEVPIKCEDDCTPSRTDTSFNISGGGPSGAFTGLVTWVGNVLTITITNDSPDANGGFLTGALFELPDKDLIISASTSDADFQAINPVANNDGVPFNPIGDTTYDKGYALDGNFQGGGNPNPGTAVGDSVTFTFTYSGGNGLTILDFYNQFNDPNLTDEVSNFIVRFKGFGNNGSDKVPGDVYCPTDEGHSNGLIIGNVLTNDTSSADMIPDGLNASNGLTVHSIANDVSNSPFLFYEVLMPNVDTVVTTNQGGTLVIRQDGSYEYTPPEGGLQNEDIIFYTTFDNDYSESNSAKLIFKPGESHCETNDVPVAVDDCACETENPIPAEWSIIVNFNNTNAGYNNSFGYYIKDANGEPTEGKIIWIGVQDGLPNSEFVLDQTVLPNVNPCDIGYFIIPNGANYNNVSDNTAVTFFLDGNNNWQAQTAVGNIPLTGQDANIFFDNGNLNVDNYPHVNNVGDGNFNWEDLLAGGDEDFNDVQVNIINNFDCPTCGITGITFGDLLANDYLSTDGGNRVASITFNGESFVVPDGGLLQLTQANLANPPGYDFVLLINSDGNYTFNPPLNFSNSELHIAFEYTLVDIDGDADTAEFCFDVLPQQETQIPSGNEESAFILSFNDENLPAPIASDDHHSVSEANLASGLDANAALLSVTGNILGNDSFDGPVEIVNIGGAPVSAGDLASGFKIVDTASGEIKVYLATGGGHNQGDYVYTLMNTSADAWDVISYSILANDQLSKANLNISIADDAPRAVSHDVMVWEQPIVAGQSGGMIVSAGNVLDGAKSGADVLPVSYAPKTAVDAISFEVMNLSNANQSAYLALGAVITILAGNISQVSLAIPLNGDVTFGLPDGSEMSMGSDGQYSFKQPVGGISADKAYAFTYQITDNDGSKAEADLNIGIKNFNAPLANTDHIWSLDSGTTKINVLDNDVLSGSVTVKEISYKDVNNLTQTILVPTSGNGSNAFTASFTTHSGAVVKIDRNGNLEYKPGAEANGQSDIDTLTYKIVETGNSNLSSIGEIQAHIYDSNAGFSNLIGGNGTDVLDATDLTGTVSMTGAGGNNEFKIDLGASSAANPNPSEIVITDLFNISANNSLTFTNVSDSDGIAGLGIGDIISSINSVSQVSPNGDIHVSFNNGTHVSFQDPGFTMSMPTANEFMTQLQEHSIQVSAQI